jgi:hypothetical protein
MGRKEGPSRLESISRPKLSYVRIRKGIGPGPDTSPFLAEFRFAQGDIKERFCAKVRIVLSELLELIVAKDLVNCAVYLGVSYP